MRYSVVIPALVRPFHAHNAPLRNVETSLGRRFLTCVLTPNCQNEEAAVPAAIRSALDTSLPSTSTSVSKPPVEVIVVDANSCDNTVRAARRAGATVLLATKPGRASQMNQGANASRGDIIMFLHADSILPKDFVHHVDAAMKTRNTPEWGCFRSIDISLRPRNPLASFLINQAVALRTKLLHKPYGDQCIFVKRKTFLELGGYADMPLLEDVDLVSRLATRTPPAIIPLEMKTSARRWDRLGVVRTTLLNQYILLRHAMGADIHQLAKLYRRGSNPRISRPCGFEP